MGSRRVKVKCPRCDSKPLKVRMKVGVPLAEKDGEYKLIPEQTSTKTNWRMYDIMCYHCKTHWLCLNSLKMEIEDGNETGRSFQ